MTEQGRSLQLTGEVTERGVTERSFTLERPDQAVPGILWLPEGATGSRPLVALGHGGTQHKRAPNILALARRLVRHHGYAAVAIDLPFHGDRAPVDEVPDEDPEQRLLRLRRRMFGREHEVATAQALGDWKAVLDAVQALGEVGAGPIGYWGVSMGTHFGVPLVASEPRIAAAVLGLFGWTEDSPLAGYGEQARSITVPVLFIVQWHDELVPRDSAFTLFDILGSRDKTLHASPGRHVAVPVAESDAAEAFFALHLGPVASRATAA